MSEELVMIYLISEDPNLALLLAPLMVLTILGLCFIAWTDYKDNKNG